MIYLRSFRLSCKTVRDPYIYPYHVFAGKAKDWILFDKITILYGDNASGKSTMLNILANQLQIEGKENATHNPWDPYFDQFTKECSYGLGEDEYGRTISKIPPGSRYIKSEDIMYEIKKIQQETVLQEGYLYEHAKKGWTKEQRDEYKNSWEMKRDMENMIYSQEKYSNGETALQIFDDYLNMDALYLLDEPEVSLSPRNQVRLAQQLNQASRFLGCQFVIATHSPFLLGTLDAKIYNRDSPNLDACQWHELENVRYFYDFFKQHEREFQ